MDIVRGSIVISKAGRDKGRLFLVTETMGEFAYIIDGDRRKIICPKKKKLKHLAATKRIFDIPPEINDKMIREMLSKED